MVDLDIIVKEWRNQEQPYFVECFQEGRCYRDIEKIPFIMEFRFKKIHQYNVNYSKLITFIEQYLGEDARIKSDYNIRPSDKEEQRKRGRGRKFWFTGNVNSKTSFLLSVGHTSRDIGGRWGPQYIYAEGQTQLILDTTNLVEENSENIRDFLTALCGWKSVEYTKGMNISQKKVQFDLIQDLEKLYILRTQSDYKRKRLENYLGKGFILKRNLFFRKPCEIKMIL